MIKRILVGLLAAILLLAGGAAAAGAIWAYSTFGMTGLMSFNAGTITPGPDARSTILDVDKFGATVPYLNDYGTTTLSVSTGEGADPTNTLFLGGARTADVNAYLKGSPYSVAHREGDVWKTTDVPGTKTPDLPRAQSFWLAQAVGQRPQITVPPERPFTIVVMHPSGIPSGPVMLSIDFTVKNASSWITGLAVTAAVLLILGILCVVLLFRMRGRKGRHQGDVAVADATDVSAN